MILIIIPLALIIVLLIYVNVKIPYGYWKKKGVTHVKPFFIFGNLTSVALRKETIYESILDLYNAFPNERYLGLFQFLTPVLMIRDPDLIKHILIRDFDHFADHRTYVEERTDPMWAKNLFALKGQNWRNLRLTLSPSFTSSKMKYMFNLMSECSDQLTKFFLEKGEDIVEIELKDVFTRYTTDVIATTCFGIQCDSLRNPNNEFYLMGSDLGNLSGFRALTLFLNALSPSLMKILKAKLIPTKVSEFFKPLIKEAIVLRTEKGLVRPDMIHLMLESRKGKHNDGGGKQILEDENQNVEDENQNIKDGIIEKGSETLKENGVGKTDMKYLTDDDIISQVLVFFLGGFDTASTLMSYIGYELAVNPHVQEKLRKEIDDAYEKCGGKITYQVLTNMTYLDMVVSETLRKWPPLGMTDRVTTKPYTIPPKLPNEKPLHLEVGTIIWTPMFAIHRDPEYHPDPEKFDPERFSEENKRKIKQYTYYPFGLGPKNCIGSRFAIVENKVLYVELLRNFEIVPVKRSPIPVRFDPSYVNLTPCGGYWMGLKRRKL